MNGNGNKWRFERRLSLDTIVSLVGVTFLIGGPFVIWARAIEGTTAANTSRISLVEAAQAMTTKLEADREQRVRDADLINTRRFDALGDKIGSVQVDIAKLAAVITQAQALAAQRDRGR